MMRYKVNVEYSGSSYCGFQKQTDIEQKSVQGVLQKAIFEMSKEEVTITPSGRTDAGVHALKQTMHFDLEKKFEAHKIVSGLNHFLYDEDVSILNCEITDEEFHARFDAKMRHYQYLIINRPAPLTLQKTQAWHVVTKLNLDEMRKAAKFLIGQHDFSAFRDSECQGKSPIKTVEKIEIKQDKEQITLDFSAKSFLHHMVRNIVGTLVWVGLGKISASEIKSILESKDRTKSGPNAPAHGLYFFGVDY